ncbi:protein obstructor-E [Aethina tumida]|uniref:protein obstructor-E n=1 Tax=Aethina tumida TaxID=116153 RepID=UPI002148455B|nr:protein obstructor-E [Aethina tumida]
MRYYLQFSVVVAVLVIQVFSQRYQSNNYVSQPNFVREAPQVSKFAGSCPEKDGRYPTSTCDGYIECKDGVPEEKLCPDGLLFNPATGPQAFPCQYPIDVDCSGRTQTQPAQATEECPHQFGYYKMGDANSCGQFKNCVDGRGFIFDCPEGLAFNEETYRCDWPDQVKSCDPEAYLGFSCPPAPKSFFGQEEYRFFRSPSDCQRYFVCVEGRPRLYNCGEGRAFNDLTNECDGIENVTGCVGANYNSNFKTTPVQLNNNNYRRF